MWPKLKCSVGISTRCDDFKPPCDEDPNSPDFELIKIYDFYYPGSECKFECIATETQALESSFLSKKEMKELCEHNCDKVCIKNAACPFGKISDFSLSPIRCHNFKYMLNPNCKAAVVGRSAYCGCDCVKTEAVQTEEKVIVFE